jgi:hypothetical protein
MTDARLVVPSGTIVDVRVTPGPPGGRTDQAGTQAAILASAMANDGTAGTAYLYAVAERGNDTIIWPTYQGIRTPLSMPATSVTEARTKSAAPPDRVGRPQDPGSTTIVRTV